MNQWSIKRRRIVLFIVLVTLAIVVGVPLFFFVYKAPTCSDSVMNADETGVDCGGSCQNLCRAESLPIIQKGDARVLRVASSTFVAVVYAQNPNVSAEVYKAGYTFKIYEASSTLPLKVISGETFVPANSPVAVFEGTFNLGENIPTRATFQWSTNLEWKKTSQKPNQLEIIHEGFTEASTTPRLGVTLRNRAPGSVSNIDLVALILDETGTIIGSSKTYINTLRANQTEVAVFIWPEPFKGNPVTIEIIPRILPDSSFIK